MTRPKRQTRQTIDYTQFLDPESDEGAAVGESDVSSSDDFLPPDEEDEDFEVIEAPTSRKRKADNAISKRFSKKRERSIAKQRLTPKMGSPRTRCSPCKSSDIEADHDGKSHNRDSTVDELLYLGIEGDEDGAKDDCPEMTVRKPKRKISPSKRTPLRKKQRAHKGSDGDLDELDSSVKASWERKPSPAKKQKGKGSDDDYCSGEWLEELDSDDDDFVAVKDNSSNPEKRKRAKSRITKKIPAVGGKPKPSVSAPKNPAKRKMKQKLAISPSPATAIIGTTSPIITLKRSSGRKNGGVMLPGGAVRPRIGLMRRRKQP